MRLAGLHEAAAVVADAVEPAGGIAFRLDRRHRYFFFLAFALPLAPFDFALAADFSSAAQSRP